MSVLVTDCPRCGAEKMTFDVTQELYLGTRRYKWQHWFEAFCVCRNCKRSTIFLLTNMKYEDQNFVNTYGGLAVFSGSLNPYFKTVRFISLRDKVSHAPPEHTPDDIADCFNEAATCLAVGCWNAAGAMFRRCLDVATRSKLPHDERLNNKTRRDLGLRLPWLFDNGILPAGLRELSNCVREDGNDGAHANIGKEDAEDLLDFTTALLERMYTEPRKLELAAARREERRASKERPSN